MIDRAASLQPARAPKQQIPLAPCKGRGRFPGHEEDRLCLPTGSVGSLLGKAMSTTDYWNTVNQTNKQTNMQAAFAWGALTYYSINMDDSLKPGALHGMFWQASAARAPYGASMLV